MMTFQIYGKIKIMFQSPPTRDDDTGHVGDVFAMKNAVNTMVEIW